VLKEAQQEGPVKQSTYLPTTHVTCCTKPNHCGQTPLSICLSVACWRA